MYVYKNHRIGLWAVGYFTPTGDWYEESKHTTPITAAARTAWLNGQPGVCPHCGQTVAKEVYGHNEPLQIPTETPKNTERKQSIR